MKAAPVLIALSLVTNCVLGVAVYSRWSQREMSPARATERATTDDDGAQQASAVAASSSEETVAVTVHAGSGESTATESVVESDAAYVARLRALGFPEELVRSLVERRVRSRYAERRRQVAQRNDGAYWRAGPFAFNPLSRKELAALRAIDQEIRAEVNRLLGTAEDPRPSPFEQMRLAPLASFLPAEKIQQVEAINRDYNDLMGEVRERARGLILRADREELRLLEREQRADLAAALTPEELAEYDLRASPTANAVRNRLRNFEPSEEEFRALVSLQLEIAHAFPGQNLSADEQQARYQAEQALQSRIQAALTPERYVEYRATIDGSFPDTLNTVRQAGLDRAAAVEVMTLKQDVAAKANAIRRDDGLTPAQRNDALVALERETVAALTTKLGEQTLADYRKRSGGSWLNHLRPRETARTTPTR